MPDTNKDTIYIDIDDEITAIIDKVQASSGKVVALVLPKRATTLQSIVNMKLLKRAGEQTKKNLVLVTTESGLLPLAGAVGLHVAKTPSSRPEIPASPADFNNAEEQIDEVDVDDGLPLEAAKPIGELAGATMPLPPKPVPENGIETLELDNAEPAATTPAFTPKSPKLKKDKKLAVPNFDRFRLVLILGGVLLLLLVVGGYFALVVLPKASIAIKTNASNINTNVDFTLSTTATSISASSKTVPAKQVQTQKTLTGNAAASGQKNNGDRAAGSVIMTAGSCSANVPTTIPSGAGLSTNGKTYITQESTSFTPVIQGNKCSYHSTDSTDIKAQTGGANFNTDNNTSFSVSGRPEISASGSASGGTDDIQTVISQADIDSAKGKITDTNGTAQDELKNQLEDQGLYAIAATYNAAAPTVSSSANVGDSASSVTVTETITYTMLGTNQDNIKMLVDNDIKSQIDTSLQGILSEGISQGAFKLKSLTSSGASMNIQTTASVGPSINTDTIAQEAAGKKSGEIESSIKSNPDVTDVTVKLSPFWVTKAPKKVSKITVTVAKPTSANVN